MNETNGPYTERQNIAISYMLHHSIIEHDPELLMCMFHITNIGHMRRQKIPNNQIQMPRSDNALSYQSSSPLTNLTPDPVAAFISASLFAAFLFSISATRPLK